MYPDLLGIYYASPHKGKVMAAPEVTASAAPLTRASLTTAAVQLTLLCVRLHT
jgi:hypothetical protein